MKNNDESMLEIYYSDVTNSLNLMSKEEAIAFFETHTFDEDEVYITTVTEEEMESVYNDESNDEYFDELDEIITNGTLEYSDNIISDIEDLDDEINIYVNFVPETYDKLYVELMREKILYDNHPNKNEVFLELFQRYLEYIKLPSIHQRYKCAAEEVSRISNYNLNDFIQRFISDEKFSNTVLLSFNNLKEYEIRLETQKIIGKHFQIIEINSINDIIRNELLSTFETLFAQNFDRITTFEKIHKYLTTKTNYYTSYFSQEKKTLLCSNDYVKAIIINDAYLMCEETFSDDFDFELTPEGTILEDYRNHTREKLIEKFNSDKRFALRTFLMFVDFNKTNPLNMSKNLAKKKYGNKKVLAKINKYNFLDYMSQN